MRLLRIAVFTLTAFGFAPIAGLAQAPLPPEQHYGEIADPSVWPFSAIGRVNRTTRSDERGFCTGTLVAANLVLTAAHCLYQDEGVRSVIHFVTAVANGVPAVPHKFRFLGSTDSDANQRNLCRHRHWIGVEP